jgi:zinc protease
MDAQPTCRRENGPGGATIFLGESRALPVVSIAIGFRGGVLDEPEGAFGLTHVGLDLIVRGRRSARTLAEAVEDLGGGVTTAVERDGFGLGITVLSRDFGAAVGVLREALRTPSFTEEDLASARRDAERKRAEAEDHPISRAMSELLSLAFAGHAYGRPVCGTAATLAGITRDGVRAWHAGCCTVGNLVVSVVGDVSFADGARVLAELAAGLPPGAGQRTHAPVTRRPQGRVERALGAVGQSVVAVAFPGPPAGSGDSMVAQLIACAFHMPGGRLWRTVRERPPHAYRVGASAISLRHGGAIVSHATTRPGLEGATIAAIAREFQSLVSRGIRGPELEAAKAHLAGSLEIARQTNAGRAAGYAMAEVAGAGTERADAAPRLLRSLGAKDIVRVAEEYVGTGTDFATVILRAG